MASESKKKFLAIEGTAATAAQAIQMCGAALTKAGYTTDEFAQKCIDREVEFPTGLPTSIPVAIPHCQSSCIIQDAMCFLRLTEPVEFLRMDDDEESIETTLIFNLAISKGQHLDFLSKTINMLQDPSILETLQTMDIDDAAPYLEQLIS